MPSGLVISKLGLISGGVTPSTQPENPIDRRHKGQRKKQEWYTCERCGGYYPRDGVIVQMGLIICLEKCYDLPGRDTFLKDFEIRTEVNPESLPEDNENV